MLLCKGASRSKPVEHPAVQCVHSMTAWHGVKKLLSQLCHMLSRLLTLLTLRESSWMIASHMPAHCRVHCMLHIVVRPS